MIVNLMPAYIPPKNVTKSQRVNLAVPVIILQIRLGLGASSSGFDCGAFGFVTVDDSRSTFY